MFIYNEQVPDIFSTNKTVHNENILNDVGFVLSSVGNAQKLNKIIKDEMKK